jgi:PAT family beta-lactamase induction signal transducer AmpG
MGHKPGVIEVYFNRRMAVLVALGFSSGLPFALPLATVQAWLTDRSISIQSIALFGLVGIPYAFKFCWSPLIDRYTPLPMGRRRGWLLITQLLLLGSIIAMGLIGPDRGLYPFAVAALLVAFFSASQDIVADAYRTDVLADHERGAGAAVFVTGYRLGYLTSSAIALIVVGRWNISWSAVYVTMGALMGIGIVATLLASEPPAPVSAPRSLHAAVVRPMLDFLLRSRAVLVILFIILYKLPDVLADALKTPFLLGVGATKEQIGTLAQGAGLALSIVGALAGGAVVVRLGLWRSLWIFGILGAVSNLGYWFLASTGLTYAKLGAVISIEYFCAGLVNAGFVAFLMSQCSRSYSATQYALLSSLMALTRIFAAPPAGWAVQHFGWAHFFAISILAAAPGLVLLAWVRPGPPSGDAAASDEVNSIPIKRPHHQAA